jgi:hypothetical protein
MKTAEKILDIFDKYGWPLGEREELQHDIAERRARCEAGQAACARGEGQTAADLQVVPITPQPSQPVGMIVGDELKKRDQQVAKLGRENNDALREQLEALKNEVAELRGELKVRAVFEEMTKRLDRVEAAAVAAGRAVVRAVG